MPDADARFTALLRRNETLFILFKVGFSTRFYYPIFSVLFLDLGLSLEQFAILNFVWAASIVCLEIPSGAWADRFGRKPFVMAAGFLMILEMLTFIMAPVGRPDLVFAFLFANRILSGAAEAFASGADESLAYESMIEGGREKMWPQLLARLMRWLSLGMFTAMLVGAASYDPAWVNYLLRALGWHSANLSAKDVIFLPIYLTLASAVVAFTSACLTTEPRAASHLALATKETSTLRQVVEAGRWILSQPFVLVVIVGGLCLDNVSRVFMTMTSNYLRLIEIPTGYFGLVSAAMMVVGMGVAPLAKWLATERSPRFNFAVLATGLWLTLLGLARAIPIYGVVLIFPIGILMQCVPFLQSHYLNASVESSRRSTVLSFKGSAINAGYGVAGLLYAGLSSVLAQLKWPSKDALFAATLHYLPWYFLFTAILVAFFGYKAAKR